MVNIKKNLDEGIENLEKGFVQQVKATAQAVAGQAGVSTNSSQGGASDAGANEAVVKAAQQAQQQSDHAGPVTDKATQEMISSLYAPSQGHESSHVETKSESGKEQKEPSEFFKKQIEEGKTPEEAAKMEQLHYELHKTGYYDPLVRRKGLEEEQKEDEEEKVEEKKMEELQVEEKKKQDDDIALKQAQQKTEKFPGASG